MAAALTYQCDPLRGYDLTVHPTATYGYLKQLVIGDLPVLPDLVAAGTAQRPLGTQVCGILAALTWSSMPPTRSPCRC
ncbi:hypothetical protein [Dactylosporangium sp. CA-233914]|uniref:hypothetical protein n=1 Tax=Dactylosporangium sp. CA-233914 TaxID=3239934 RepID=UPI003D89B45F